jgi:hypothetical protein
MAKNDTLTAEYVRSILDYDPETGIFVYKKRGYGSFDKQFAGKEAGWINDNGYLIITINSKDYRSHRLAYLIMMGEWPEEDVDHENRIRTDNRWCNLRGGTRTNNLFNKTIQSNNKLGIKNVSMHQGRYRVEIRKGGKRVYSALFDCVAAASIDAQLAQIKIAGEFAHHAYAIGGDIGK